MSRPDAVSDSAPTVLLEELRLEDINQLLGLKPDETTVLTGQDAKKFATLTEIRLHIHTKYPKWDDQQIDEYLREQFREEPRT